MNLKTVPSRARSLHLSSKRPNGVALVPCDIFTEETVDAAAFGALSANVYNSGILPLIHAAPCTANACGTLCFGENLCVQDS